MFTQLLPEETGEERKYVRHFSVSTKLWLTVRLLCKFYQRTKVSVTSALTGN